MIQEKLAYLASLSAAGVLAAMVIMRGQMRSQLRPIVAQAASRSEMARRLVCKMRGMDYYSGRHRLVMPA